MARRSIYRYGWGDGQWSFLVLQLGNGHLTGDIRERSMTGTVGEPVSGVYWYYSWGTVIRLMLLGNGESTGTVVETVHRI
jgi:hypothetical protein